MKQPILNTVNHRNTQPPSVTHAGTRHFKCNRTGQMKHQCPMNLNRTAAMFQMNDQEAAMSSYPHGELHNFNESPGDGEVKLACGCMLPVVAGALGPDGQLKFRQWQTQMIPCSRGRINGTRTIVMRDTGSTTCVVKKSLVKPEQMSEQFLNGTSAHNRPFQCHAGADDWIT